MINLSGPASEFRLYDLPNCTKASGYLTACQTPAGEVRLPVLAGAGAHRGPVLCAVAGVHGNEYEGQEAIRLFFEQLDPVTLSGSFLGIPVCNVFAYEARDRVSPDFVDGANMARIFPGSPTGSASERLAHAIFSLVTRNMGPDSIFVDFHSAESTYTLLPLAGYRAVDNPSRERSANAARVLKRFHLWEVPSQPGRLNSEIAMLGITAVGTEITGGAGCDPNDVKRYVDALESLATLAGLKEGTVSPDTAATAMKPTTLFAPESGYLRLTKRLGDRVLAGELLATVIGPAGEVRGEVRSPAAGLLCGARRTPMVWAKETCFWLSPDDSSLIR